jgi:carbamoylphosphate synthase small subunit
MPQLAKTNISVSDTAKSTAKTSSRNHSFTVGAHSTPASIFRLFTNHSMSCLAFPSQNKAVALVSSALAYYFQ